MESPSPRPRHGRYQAALRPDKRCVSYSKNFASWRLDHLDPMASAADPHESVIPERFDIFMWLNQAPITVMIENYRRELGL